MAVWPLAASLLVSLAAGCSATDETAGPSGGGSSKGSVIDGGGSASGDAGFTGPPTASLGASAVLARDCASCHTPAGQPELSGAIAALPGYPDGVALWAPNLTPDPETGIGAWTDGQLRLAIREGVDREGLVLCPQMQHYKTMPDAEVDAIIKYLRSLPPAKHLVRESVCPPLKR